MQSDFALKEIPAEQSGFEEANYENPKIDKVILEKSKKSGAIDLAVYGAFALGYGLFKLTPKIKNWRANRKNNDKSDQ